MSPGLHGLTLYDVFELARRIERSGAEYYRVAAERSPEGPAKALFQRLAADEVRHHVVFVEMRDKTGEGSEWRVADEPGRLVEALKFLENHIEKKILPMLDFDAARLAGATERDVLLRAIDFEERTILFYNSVKRLFPHGGEWKAINDIILEEHGHVDDLWRTAKGEDR